MPGGHDELRGERGEVHFSWTRHEDGTWGCETMWGRTTRSGAPVEKHLEHLVKRRFTSEAACREALEQAAKGWLYEHR